jgi:hypothetical protein
VSEKLGLYEVGTMWSGLLQCFRTAGILRHPVYGYGESDLDNE